MAMLYRASVLAATLVLSVAGSVCAQEYPVRAVHLLTAETGGGSDVASRMIAQEMSGSLGQQVVVENRSGALLCAQVAKAAPDGYTMMLFSATVWEYPMMTDHAQYDAVKDFAPVTLVGTSPTLVVVHPSLPVRNVKELIALAKARPNELNYGTATVGGLLHLAAELFNSMAHTQIVHVPYRGVGLAVTDFIGGRVQVMFPNAGAVTQYLKSGRLRALAVGSAKPSAVAPGLPTVAAAGLPGYEAVAMYVVFVPAKTPQARITRLNQEFVRALAKPELKEKFFAASAEVSGSTPEQLAAEMQADMMRMDKVIKSAHIRVE